MRKITNCNGTEELGTRSNIRVVSQEINRIDRTSIFVLQQLDSQIMIRLGAHDIAENDEILRQCELQDIKLIISVALEEALSSQTKSAA